MSCVKRTRAYSQACFLAFLLAHLIDGKVLILTDSNFDKSLAESNSDFLVDIYAPWCSHCRQLEPTWEKVAEDLEGQVHVAKVDATENEVLRTRFFVTAFPTIVHLSNGQTRDFTGSRDRESLTSFALEDWSDVAPRPFYMAPNSRFGRVLGSILGIPNHVVKLATYMSKTLQIPQLAIALIFLLFPIAFGIATICILDYLNTRPLQPARHEHQQ